MNLAGLSGLELRVNDPDRMMGFYQGLLGLEPDPSEDGLLAPSGRLFTLRLHPDPSAPVRPQPSIGLFHFAILVPDRASLGGIFLHLRASGWPLEGASDHGVSEALYLRDPEGNGIEIYRDRPEAEWPRQGDRIAMFTRPLDLDGLMEAAPDPKPLPAGTRLGHMHLHVADLSASGSFYQEHLGLEVTQADFPGALFLSFGGYHHHVGLNTWTRARAPEGATGLIAFHWATPEPPGAMHDPDGNRVEFEPPRGLTG